MEPQAKGIDLSDYGAPKRNSRRSATQAKNKNGVYIAVIVVSFCVTIILYTVAFKNAAPARPDLAPLPPVIRNN